MQDEYAYLRGQYEAIVDHCEYLLRISSDPTILRMAEKSRRQAAAELAKLNRRDDLDSELGTAADLVERRR
jgi:hypothetical protein